MILPDHEIFRQRAGGALGIEPFNKEQLQPASYDMKLDKFFRFYDPHEATNKGRRAINPKSPDRRTKMIESPTFQLKKRGFVLASTVERIVMPDHLVGRVEGKSSLARLGLFVHVTAGFIDPGFEGFITLELFNANNFPIVLYADMPICQISFERMSSPAQIPYGSDGLGSKYSNQRQGPVESMYWMNYLEE